MSFNQPQDPFKFVKSFNESFGGRAAEGWVLEAVKSGSVEYEIIPNYSDWQYEVKVDISVQ